MRIGMILDASFPPDPRVENEALSLIRAGHEIYLFSLDFKQQSGTELYKGIHIVRYPASRLLHKLSALAYTFPFYRWKVSSYVADFIKTNSIETLHVHDMVIANAVFYANRSFTLPIVLDYHENRPEIMKQYKHVNTISGQLLIDLKKWSGWYYELASRAQRVVVITEAAKCDIAEKTKKSPDKIAVVPNSVDPGEFLKHPIEQDIVNRMQGSFNLLYIGDTSIRRGIDTAIIAVSILKSSIPNIKLWLIGKGSADDDLKRLCERLDVTDRVEFEGWQNPSTFPSYLHNTNLALSPLKRNLHHDTTYANKLFQYMVCGKPLIVSDSTAQADLVTDEACGLVFKADVPQDLADKILYLYNNQAEAQAMGARGKDAVINKWNWELTVKPLIDIYAHNIAE
jgi:glycosyltransferase involved in cell wall biosynthesis